MNVEVHVENVFPIPIYSSIIDISNLIVDDIPCKKYRDIRDRNPELDVISASENEKLLQTELKFSELKKIIDQHMLHFYENVLGYDSEDVYPEMVASWLVKSEPGNQGKMHSHVNSTFSGVVYLKTHEHCGKITFVLREKLIQCLDPPIKTFNSYNDRSLTFHVRDGLLLLFPSWLLHKVEKNNSDKIRYSIGFNYFLKGIYRNHTAGLELK